MQPNGNVKVFSTTAMINDIVRQIGGSYIDSSVLIKGELDPHTYQLVKGDDEKLALADIIFYNGLGLEHGPGLQEYLNQHSKAIPLGNRLMEKHPEWLLKYKGQLDPHIWMDISIWTQIVPFIVEALSKKDPAHADQYHANGEKLLQEMLQVHHQISKELQSIPGEQRYLVTSHDAFNYFARVYLKEDQEAESMWRERFVAPEGLAPESQISTTNIRNIIQHISKYHIHVIFPESNVSRDSIRKIVLAAKEEGINLKVADVFLYADAMGKSGSDGDTYLKMMQHNASVITSNLKANP
jgi:manganese/zinc/iron transport system substrate-binding protein